MFRLVGGFPLCADGSSILTVLKRMEICGAHNAWSAWFIFVLCRTCVKRSMAKAQCESTLGFDSWVFLSATLSAMVFLEATSLQQECIECIECIATVAFDFLLTSGVQV